MFRWVRSRALYNEIIRLALLIVAVVGILLLLGSLGYVDLPFIGRVSPLIFNGALVTLAATGVMLPLSFGLGFLIGWGRISRNYPAYWVSTLFVEVFRGTPQLVLVIVAFFVVLPLVAPQMSINILFAFWVGTLALALHSAAYQGEIFRNGFQSVPTGQIEAARSLGLDSTQTMSAVIFPQAVRVSLPPLGNEFANLVKDSAIISALGVLDLTGWGRQIQGITFDVNAALFSWVIIAIVYFFIIYILSAVMIGIERKLQVPGLEEGL